jgi:hypothetical protein
MGGHSNPDFRAFVWRQLNLGPDDNGARLSAQDRRD